MSVPRETVEEEGSLFTLTLNAMRLRPRLILL